MFKPFKYFLKSKRKITFDAFKWFFTLIGVISALIFCVDILDSQLNQVPEKSLIDSMTTGEIEAQDNLIIRFKEKAIPYSMIGKEAPDHLIKVSPKIKGTLKWLTLNELAFIPSAPLKQHQKYTYKVLVNKVFPNKPGFLKIEKAKITISGQTLIDLQHHWTSSSTTDSNKVILKGHLTLKNKVKITDLKASFYLLEKGKKKPLKIQAVNSLGTKFTFESPVFDRKRDSSTIFLLLDNKPLNLAQEYKKKVNWVQTNQFKALNIHTKSNLKNPKLKIDFSDALKAQQDIRGLIQIKDIAQQDLQLKIVGHSVHVMGPFKSGKTYSLSVLPGVVSEWDVSTKEKQVFLVNFEHQEPALRFVEDGFILPSNANGKLLFESINLKRVRIDVIKVDEEDFSKLTEEFSFASHKNRHLAFGSYLINQGYPLVSQSLEIDPESNSWFQHEIDFKKLFKKESSGVFLISLSFSKEDVIFDEIGKNKKYPMRYFKSKSIHKPIILSDIGITLKKTQDDYIIYLNDILSGEALSQANVEVYTERSWRSRNYNKKVATLKTNNQGQAILRKSLLKTKYTNRRYYKRSYQSGFILKISHQNKYAFYSSNHINKWNDSTFDTGGVKNSQKLSTFIYTDRGVYRPGDTIHLSFIAKENRKSFPDNLPITLKVYNPKNQEVFQITNNSGTDGFYSFEIPTDKNALTGTWQARIKIADQRFNHAIKVENIVPYKLKIKSKLSHLNLSPEQNSSTFSLESHYLVGKVANNHKATVQLQLFSKNKQFKNYQNFNFSHHTKELQPIDTTLFDGELDANGKLALSLSVPPISQAPSSISGKLISTVYEKSARPVRKLNYFSYDLYSEYVGIEKINSERLYFKTNSSISMGLILLSKQGIPIKNKKLHYRIFLNKKFWWWEFQQNSDNRLSYKEDKSTVLIKEGTLTSDLSPQPLNFSPTEKGVYLVEVSAPGKNSHTSSQFIYVSSRGQESTQGNAGSITLETDKKSYEVGDKAQIKFPAASESKVLVSIEKENKVLDSFWYTLPKNKNEGLIEFNITEAMVPNAYVAISVIQGNAKLRNDLPMRLYGICPIMVKNKKAIDNPRITVSNELEPLKEFTVEIQSEYEEQSQFTLAIVDEGLLDITDFKTPDPSDLFFMKERLDVETFDIYGQVLGINRGDIYRRFSIGGSDSLERRQEIATKIQRFTPLAIFKGPFKTNSKGYAKLSFKMPQYVGSARIMLVGTKNSRFASAEKTVNVRSPLMIIPSLPRTLKSKDEFEIKVSVLSDMDTSKNVKLSIETEGALEVLSPSYFEKRLQPDQEKVFTFQVKTKNQTGSAQIKFRAQSDHYETFQSVDIPITIPSPQISKLSLQKGSSLNQNESLIWTLPKAFIEGSDTASISLSKIPYLAIDHRLDYLIRYPYGCIEQLISAVLPQLYLKDLSQSNEDQNVIIDNHINSTIERLKYFQTESGGFAYWPGTRSPSYWGSNYAGHFLLLAKRQGYYVPNSLIENWIHFQQKTIQKGNPLERTYRLYLLALAEKANLGAMNQIQLTEFENLQNPEKWLLAASYSLAGDNSQAKKIAKNASYFVKEYNQLGDTYGSTLRDKAIILSALIDLDHIDEELNPLIEEIAIKLGSDTWYSTQTLGYALLAMGRYLKENSATKRETISGTIYYDTTKQQPFSIQNSIDNIPIYSGFGKEIKVKINKGPKTYVQINWQGSPNPLNLPRTNEKISLERFFLDEKGVPISIVDMTQGDSFWIYYKLSRNENTLRKLEELAINQIIPSGWEIINNRLFEDSLPTWTKDLTLGLADHMDIKDDRISWFFDLKSNTQEIGFLVKIAVVTPGYYTLAPAIAEAMYDDSYRSIIPGNKVLVSKP